MPAALLLEALRWSASYRGGQCYDDERGGR
jgi:hypothetical protein